MKIHSLPFYGFFYAKVMRFAHRHHWHYAPPIYPDGDTQLWCQWCGFRQTIEKASHPVIVNNLETGDEDLGTKFIDDHL